MNKICLLAVILMAMNSCSDEEEDNSKHSYSVRLDFTNSVESSFLIKSDSSKLAVKETSGTCDLYPEGGICYSSAIFESGGQGELRFSGFGFNLENGEYVEVENSKLEWAVSFSEGVNRHWTTVNDSVAEICSYNGGVYSFGESFPSDCNTCTCTEDGLFCSEMACMSNP